MKFDSQDDEYLASLQADQEKELKALQEAEVRRQEEIAAREAAIDKQKQEEEERRKKKLEEEVQFRYILSGR
jgi:conjugal transfer/entry exclusion protein